MKRRTRRIARPRPNAPALAALLLRGLPPPEAQRLAAAVSLLAATRYPNLADTARIMERAAERGQP